MQAVNEEEKEKGYHSGSQWRSTLRDIVGRIKWFYFGVLLIYVVTLSIFPGYVTEDVHFLILKDSYHVLLITGDNVFDLISKTLPATDAFSSYITGLFLDCLQGPASVQSEIPVTILTCLLGLTNGCFTGVMMILAPKTVLLQHSETARIEDSPATAF